jgi:hypothetical protein
VNHKLDPNDIEQLGESLADVSFIGKVETWISRSNGITDMLERTAAGRFYGNRALSSLLKGEQKLAENLGINLADYKVFREVQLWIDEAKGQFMIADILLVKYSSDGTRITDVIIGESKLGSLTDYTIRQKQGWKIVANGPNGQTLKVKAPYTNVTEIVYNGGNEFTPVLGNSTLSAGDNLTVNKVKRISDHGNKNGRFDVSDVNTNDYQNYIPPKQQ